MSIRTFVVLLKPCPLIVTNTPPPVPLNKGVRDVADKENVNVVVEEVI